MFDLIHFSRNQVKIVSFLHAPGFCTVACEGYKGDWSSAGVDGSVSVHLRINPRNEGHPNAQNLTFFALQVSRACMRPKRGGRYYCVYMHNVRWQ